MADTQIAAALISTHEQNKYYMEYIRENRFKRVMGTDENAIIQMVMDLEKKNGDTIVVSLLNRLEGDGVVGSATLDGFEEAIVSRSQGITVDWLRNGVRMDKRQQKFSAIDVFKAARPMLKTWSMNNLRNAIIQALGSIDGVNLMTASTAQKNTWATNNSDRSVYGVNNYTTDFATSTAQIDATNDKLSVTVLDKAKQKAKEADPHIRPIRTTEDEEWYVMFANSRAFRDLRADTTLQTSMQQALERSKSNPLFSGGDLIWDGIIIKEIVEIGTVLTYPAWGAGGTVNVGPNFLCGAQALAIAWAQTTQFAVDNLKDYGFRPGVALEECRGMQKLRFGTGASDLTTPKDHGIVTVWASAAA